jgi:hypothetical protein
MINIDLTTKNTVYNTLGPQAQWVQHRFGRRDYPDIDLDLRAAAKIIEQNPLETIHFISTFGDPSQHTNIDKIVELINPGKLVFNSHLNFKNDLLIELLNNKHSYVVFPCYGVYDLADKILLHNDWQLVENNLSKLKSVCVEFYLFEHNIHQIPIIKNLCNKLSLELKIKPGTFLHPAGFSTIVDENKNWLYDVYSCKEDSKNTKWPVLHKTVNGYNSLIQYVKPYKGKSILANPNFYKLNNNVIDNNNISVSFTSHVFPSFELHQVFSNALCTDWNFSFSNITEHNKISVKPEYKHLCSSLTRIQEMLEFNNVLTTKYSDLLANFTNSNV